MLYYIVFLYFVYYLYLKINDVFFGVVYMKKIAVITGTRAEYGLLRKLCRLIDLSRDLTLNLIVTGSHLSKTHGFTFKEIKEDGFSKFVSIDLKIKGDTPHAINKVISEAIKKFSLYFKKNTPDIAIVLGDRYEMMGVATALAFHQIPIAHIGGGEITEGAIDNEVRHCLTKLSSIHFTSTKQYMKRVIQLGENPNSVFYVGGLGAQAVNDYNLLTKKKLEKNLGIKFSKKNLIVTYHPETMSKKNTLSDLKELLKALDNLSETNIIFTMPNADEGFKKFFNTIENFVCLRPKNRKLFKSLGHMNYLSCLKFVDAVIGNSSSGILEAPSFKVGIINIGDRQKGRVRAKTIIDVNPTKTDITKAINQIYSKNYQNLLKKISNPYLKNKTAENILKVIKKNNIIQVRKSFYDL